MWPAWKVIGWCHCLLASCITMISNRNAVRVKAIAAASKQISFTWRRLPFFLTVNRISIKFYVEHLSSAYLFLLAIDLLCPTSVASSCDSEAVNDSCYTSSASGSRANYTFFCFWGSSYITALHEHTCDNRASESSATTCIT